MTEHHQAPARGSISGEFADTAASPREHALELISDMIKAQTDPAILQKTMSLVSIYEKALRQCHEEATTDVMSGLLNRRGLEQAYQHIQSGVRRANFRKTDEGEKKHGYLVFIDLVGLKSMNENLGHATGDLAITTAAAGLQKIGTRDNDKASRLGGDEFVLALEASNNGFEDILRNRLAATQRDMYIQTSAGRRNVGFRYNITKFDENMSFEDALRASDPKLEANKPSTTTLVGVANDRPAAAPPAAPHPPAAAA